MSSFKPDIIIVHIIVAVVVVVVAVVVVVVVVIVVRVIKIITIIRGLRGWRSTDRVCPLYSRSDTWRLSEGTAARWRVS